MIVAERPLLLADVAQGGIELEDVGVGVGEDKAGLVRIGRKVPAPLPDQRLAGLILPAAPMDRTLPRKDRQGRQELALVHQVEGAPLLGVGHPHDLVQFGAAVLSP